MQYTLNNYRSRKFGNRHFLTTDHGSFCILSDKEFRKLKGNKFDDDKKLFRLLEEREIILNEKNIGETIRLTRNRLHYLSKGTSLHIIVLTRRCNMNCIYCQAGSAPAGKKGFDMDRETAKRTVDFIFQTPAKNFTVEFQGGEPLLNWDVLAYIVKYAKERNRTAGKNMRISVVTNLSLMDEEKFRFLVDEGIRICTSFDGPKQIHDSNRILSGRSNYEQVVGWLERFRTEYKKRNINAMGVSALVTLTRKSLGYPEEIVDEYVKAGLNLIHLRFLHRLGVAKATWSEINYSVDEYLDFWKKAVNHIEKLKSKGININERMVAIMARKIGNELDPDYLDMRSPCGAAIGQLAYNYDGDIFTCDEARMLDEDLFRLGNVNEDIYTDIVTCDKACAVINSSINDQYVCDNCAYKPYCGICPVCNYAEQGNIIGKISETDRCKIFKAQFDWVVSKKFINLNK